MVIADEYFLISEYMREVGSSIDDVKQFISVVSENYHNIEASFYDARHGEIFEDATAEGWECALAHIRTRLKNPIRVLDIGCGTGYASQQVLRHIGASKIEKLVCIDTSIEMLHQCRESLTPFECPTDFVCGDVDCLNEGMCDFDLVITNSVVHHILDLDRFFFQINSVIKDNGFYIMGHEPNKFFYEHEILQNSMNIYRMYRKVRNNLRPSIFLRRFVLKKEPINISASLNTLLIGNGIISRPMEDSAIRKLIDIHVPVISNERNYWGMNGFDIAYLNQNYLPGFVIEFSRTYHHIKDATSRLNGFWRMINRYLLEKYPYQGADVLSVYWKKA